MFIKFFESCIKFYVKIFLYINYLLFCETFCVGRYGEVAEWSKAHAWKVCIRFEAVSWVRIPLSPQNENKIEIININ